VTSSQSARFEERNVPSVPGLFAEWRTAVRTKASDV
jgi:hypothetical protein